MNLVPATGAIVVDDKIAYPNNQYKAVKDKNFAALKAVNSTDYVRFYVDYTTIEGAAISSSKDIFDWLVANGFDDGQSGGGGGGGEGDAATLNGQSGSYYRNRANHTGTQSMSTVSGLSSALGNKLENITGLITEGTNVSISGTGTESDPYEISAQGGSGGGVQTISAGSANVTIDDDDPENVVISVSQSSTTVEWDGISGDQSDVNLSGFTNDLGLGTAAMADTTDFATSAQGALAETAVQPGDLPATPTWSTISGKPTVVAEGATQAAARSSIGAGTSNLSLGTTSTTAMAGNTPVVKSQQEGGVGTVITNHIALTQAQYDGLATKNASTVYEIIE